MKICGASLLYISCMAVAVSSQVPLLFFLSGYTFRPKSIRLLGSPVARTLGPGLAVPALCK